MRISTWLVLSALGAFAVACGSVTAVKDDGGAGQAGSGQAGTSASGAAGASAGTSGSAGATAGAGGVAGAAGLAGTSGTAGAGGHAGASGAAGASGTAGATGHAGAMGSAGSTGAAGTGAGGGTAADGGVEDCTTLMADFTAAMKEAKVCDPTSRVAQCTFTTPNALQCSSCDTHVDSTTKLDAIQGKWTKQGCGKGVLCPGLTCATAGKGVCTGNDAGSTCTDDRSLTPN
jgi:hypothetical protein